MVLFTGHQMAKLNIFLVPYMSYSAIFLRMVSQLWETITLTSLTQLANTHLSLKTAFLAMDIRQSSLYQRMSVQTVRPPALTISSQMTLKT